MQSEVYHRLLTVQLSFLALLLVVVVMVEGEIVDMLAISKDTEQDYFMCKIKLFTYLTLVKVFCLLRPFRFM
jgi:hypothetical protein